MLHGAGQVDHSAEINKPSLQHYTSSVQGYRLPSLIRWMTASSTQHNHWMHLIFAHKRETWSIVAYAAHNPATNTRSSVFGGQIANTWAEDEHRKFPVSLNLLTQLAGTWNINSGCIPSEWGGGVLKGEVCLTERLMYAPRGLGLVKKTRKFPISCSDFSLPACFDSANMLLLFCSDFFFSYSLKVFFSHFEKRRE